MPVIDLPHDLNDLVMLKDRYGHPTDAAARQSCAKLFDYRDGGIFATHFRGSSGWERRPQGDEIVHILAGATRLDLIVDDVLHSRELAAGMLTLVPKGCWHRFESETGVKVLTATPLPAEYTLVEDPRTAA